MLVIRRIKCFGGVEYAGDAGGVVRRTIAGDVGEFHDDGIICGERGRKDANGGRCPLPIAPSPW